jgi:hypothetical protein
VSERESFQDDHGMRLRGLERLEGRGHVGDDDRSLRRRIDHRGE